MDNQKIFSETRLGKVEDFSLNSFELFKLKTIDKTASIASTFISRLIFGIAFSLFMLTLSIALGFLLGDLTGKLYIGFLLVACTYFVIAVVIYILHRTIKFKINDSIIFQFFN